MHDIELKTITVKLKISNLVVLYQNSLHITNVPNIKKTGICGNGECEKGERCDMNYESAIHHGSNTCCFQDCPYVSFACPIPPHGPHNNNPSQACSRRGICLDASGQCKCFLGNTSIYFWNQVYLIYIYIYIYHVENLKYKIYNS